MRNALPMRRSSASRLYRSSSAEDPRVFGDYVSVYDFGDSIPRRDQPCPYYGTASLDCRSTTLTSTMNLEALLDGADLDDAQGTNSHAYSASSINSSPARNGSTVLPSISSITSSVAGSRGKDHGHQHRQSHSRPMYDKVHAMWQRRLNEARAAGTQIWPTTWHPPAWRWSSQAQNRSRRHGSERPGHHEPPCPHGQRRPGVPVQDPADPLRIVFVCAMWTTGFDGYRRAQRSTSTNR